MSFAHDVKIEVISNKIQSECCKLAFLSSVIHSCGELTKSGNEFFLELKTDIFEIFDLINDSLNTLYGLKAEIKKILITMLQNCKDIL